MSKLLKKIKKHRNKIRDLSNLSSDFMKYVIGNYYEMLHTILIIGGAAIILFSKNISHLAALLFIMSLDAFAIVVRHDCPLTEMEEKYLGVSGKRRINNFFKSSGLVYNCSHLYESQLELVVNFWALTACKIVMLICLKMLKIELNVD
jgi:hypothetical protein